MRHVSPDVGSWSIKAECCCRLVDFVVLLPATCKWRNVSYIGVYLDVSLASNLVFYLEGFVLFSFFWKKGKRIREILSWFLMSSAWRGGCAGALNSELWRCRCPLQLGWSFFSRSPWPMATWQGMASVCWGIHLCLEEEYLLHRKLIAFYFRSWRHDVTASKLTNLCVCLLSY